jgi:hypothetical protein
MGVPACLWRRTGEIYKGNREFSELVGVDGYMMRDVSCLDVIIKAARAYDFFVGPPLHLRAYGRRVSSQLLGGEPSLS